MENPQAGGGVSRAGVCPAFLARGRWESASCSRGQPVTILNRAGYDHLDGTSMLSTSPREIKPAVSVFDPCSSIEHQS